MGNISVQKFVNALRYRILPRVNSSDPDKPMRTAFLSRLLVYASFAFIASLALSFTIETRTSLREVKRRIESKFTEEFERTEYAKQTYLAVERQSTAHAVVVAHAIAKHLAYNPGLAERCVEDPSLVEEMARIFDVGEICIANDDAIIIAAYPQSSIGFDYKTSKFAKEFIQILDNPKLEITQPIRESEGTNHQNYKYTGVAREDAPGLIEIGVDASRIKQLYELADFSRYVDPIIGREGFMAIFLDNEQLIGEPLPAGLEFTSGKSAIKRINDRVYFTFAEQKDKLFFVGGIPQTEVFRDRSLIISLLILGNFILFLVVFLLVSNLVQGLFVKSVEAINHSLEKITNGDLSERVNVNSTKEFVELSAGVNATVDSLKHAAEEVERKTREEMALAHRIQMATQPNLRELYADAKEFDVYAENHPKANVGGDVYDFFFIDETRLVFYVADVSGCGVPAALIMMKTAALVKNLALSEFGLDEVVTRANYYLSIDAHEALVSGFFCMLDLATGRVQYINAGHISPFIKGADGVFRLFDSDISLILGGAPDTQYKSSTLQLSPGDVVALCTDGFAVAFASDYVDSSEIKTRIGAIFNGAPENATAEELVKITFSEMEKVTGSSTPLDDETALVFRFLAYKHD